MNRNDSQIVDWESMEIRFLEYQLRYLYNPANDEVMIKDVPHFDLARRFYKGDRSDGLYEEMDDLLGRNKI